MYRSNSYDETLSQELKDPEFAQEYLLALTEDEDEPMDIEDALRLAITKMGTTDFAQIISEDKANVDKFIKGKRNLKEDTLNRYLSHFELKIKKTLEVA
ncbi:MAG: hypothetical protein ISR65_18895 [Bacteriovoracaceae bacterium]|nr:hypothetical protein [Bacteriovoracaceae bacterium]